MHANYFRGGHCAVRAGNSRRNIDCVRISNHPHHPSPPTLGGDRFSSAKELIHRARARSTPMIHQLTADVAARVIAGSSEARMLSSTGKGLFGSVSKHG